MPHANNPYNEQPRFEVKAKLNLCGDIEFIGVRYHTDGRLPTSELDLCGIPVAFATPEDSDRFAQAAVVMANQHHIAWDRNLIAREPKGDPQ